MYVMQSADDTKLKWQASAWKTNDATIQLFDAAYCLAYVLFLGRFYVNQAGASTFDDGSWAIVPIAVKAICGVCALAAASGSRGKATKAA